MQAPSRSRTPPLLIAFGTLTTNLLSSFLFSRLGDGQRHFANVIVWYLYGACFISIFGGLGIWKKHALTVFLFSKYLLLDALLSTIPRLMVLVVTIRKSSELCNTSHHRHSTASTSLSTSQLGSLIAPTLHLQPSDTGNQSQLHSGSVSLTLRLHSWQHGLIRRSSSSSSIDCEGIIFLAEFTLCILVLAAAVFQLWGALTTRSYARKLYARDTSKLIDGMYRDNAQNNDLEIATPFGQDENATTRAEENEEVDVAGGPWTCFGEFAGGITRWVR